MKFKEKISDKLKFVKEAIMFFQFIFSIQVCNIPETNGFDKFEKQSKCKLKFWALQQSFHLIKPVMHHYPLLNKLEKITLSAN